MQPCKFTFDDERVWDGFAHGSTWNGFDNVAVSKDVLEQIIAATIADGGNPQQIEEGVASFREIEPMENGLYSLGWGFATQIVTETKTKEA